MATLSTDKLCNGVGLVLLNDSAQRRLPYRIHGYNFERGLKHFKQYFLKDHADFSYS
ncbi:hypothetical protein [Bartonella gabonensis]|uniref:hypothetical protein n=1 Tax=Bartonella gabonensis TaxID=2699889 RepID=UPI00158A4C38|nr:hypothetical protein [Bartonella gabonensis]